MEELLYQYNPWWEDEYKLIGIFERQQYTRIIERYINTKHIVLITGLRRVGKTTLMKIIINDLLKKNINRTNILYVSVDDYLLIKKNINEIIDEFKKIHKKRSHEKIYLFLDEITYQPDYHQQLKNLYDKFNIKIFASSSSSSLLKDKKAFLTGRAITVEIQPLDFEEYKIFKNINLKKKDAILNEAYFKDYIQEGGMPENVLNPSREYLMNLTDDIIQKDITAYHGLKNHQLMRDYYTLLMERSGKQYSINKIANVLKLSPDTARRYLSYYVETYLIHLLPRWGKTNEKLLSAKKIYACDLGIKHLFTGTRDLGSYFENYIYLKLKNHKELYYLYENGIEIDFFTGDKTLIESKYGGELTEKQEKLFTTFKAEQRIVIDSVNKLQLLDDIIYESG